MKSLEDRAREFLIKRPKKQIGGPHGWTDFHLEEISSYLADFARQVAREERERAAKIADKWAHSRSCKSHDNNPCCHVRTGAGIAAAIRSLRDE